VKDISFGSLFTNEGYFDHASLHVRFSIVLSTLQDYGDCRSDVTLSGSLKGV